MLCESSLSGYQIKKTVDMRFKYFWSESYGQIYPELARMESNQLIQKSDAREETEDIHRKNSCKYEITEQGKKELKKWLAEPIEKESVRYELILKLYFSNLIKPDVMMENIREFQRVHRKQQHMFDEFRIFFEANLYLHDNHLEQLMVVLFGQKVWKAYDEWCDEVLGLLEMKKVKEGIEYEQDN